MTAETVDIGVRTLIVGGGIGGLATALGLARNGTPVHLIERADEFGEVGAGIQLAPNAMAVLDRLGVVDEIMKDAVLPQRKVYIDAVTGTTISSIDLGPKFVDHYGYPYVVTHRADLHRALLTACRAEPLVTLENSRHVLRVEDLGDVAKAHCGDGTVYTAETLIGADGLHSATRKLFIDDDVIPSHYVAYRGTVPIEMVPAEAVATPMVVCWLGPSMHLIQYPLRGGELYNQVAVFKTDNYSPDHDDWGTTDELDARFSVCTDKVRDAAKLLNRNIRWPMYDREPIAKWVRGRIALLGDAAHPMLQYLAQGGAQSLDDAAAIAEILGRADDIPSGLALYESERQPHTANIQRLARVAGELFHIEGIGRELRNRSFEDHDPEFFDNLDWMFMPRDRAPKARSYPI